MEQQQVLMVVQEQLLDGLWVEVVDQIQINQVDPGGGGAGGGTYQELVNNTGGGSSPGCANCCKWWRFRYSSNKVQISIGKNYE